MDDTPAPADETDGPDAATRAETPGAAAGRSSGRGAPVGWVVVALGVGVLAAGATGGLTGGLPAGLGATLTRTGMDVAAVVCAGTMLLTLLAPDRPDTGGDADRVLTGASTTWLGLILLNLVFRSAVTADVPVTAVQPTDLVTFVTGPDAGAGLVVGAVCAALVLGCALGRPSTPGHGSGPAVLTLLLALAGLTAPAVTGHAVASGNALPVSAVVLHAPAAALWVGGLGALLTVAGRADVLDAALPRFSRLAGMCVGVLAVTGVGAATARIQTWPALISPYGALLLTKAVCLALAALLGGLARRRLRAGRTPVLAWAGVEVLVLAVTVGVAATLTQTG